MPPYTDPPVCYSDGVASQTEEHTNKKIFTQSNVFILNKYILCKQGHMYNPEN